MSRTRALAASTAFLVMPAIVAGLVPWLLDRWHTRMFFTVPALRIAGDLAIAFGVAVLLDSFRRFAVEGLGTPAPIAPTKTLVVTGFYRYVRNPMYVALIAIVLGQALLFEDWVLAVYALAIWIVTNAFVTYYEEPKLRRTYGVAYEAYCAHVPRWFPR
jgi:protein-S-isoprenylcysteine O-methyltransferase Ste14